MYTSKIKEKTFVLCETNANVINVYIGEFTEDAVPDNVITLDNEITSEKEFHVEISYWAMYNQ